MLTRQSRPKRLALLLHCERTFACMVVASTRSVHGHLRRAMINGTSKTIDMVERHGREGTLKEGATLSVEAFTLRECSGTSCGHRSAGHAARLPFSAKTPKSAGSAWPRSVVGQVIGETADMSRRLDRWSGTRDSHDFADRRPAQCRAGTGADRSEHAATVRGHSCKSTTRSEGSGPHARQPLVLIATAVRGTTCSVGAGERDASSAPGDTLTGCGTKGASEMRGSHWY